MQLRLKILIINDVFFPGYKAGGPIQSLTNLVAALIEEFDIYVITSAYDLNDTSPYEGINVNSWNKIHLPLCIKTTDVFYADKRFLRKKNIEEIFQNIKPHCIYLNGIFSYHYFLLPLIIKRKFDGIIVVSPRGMLQKGALSGKPFKKKVYLSALKWFGLTKNIKWHATNDEEKTDIIKNFPVNQGVVIASNIPKPPLKDISFLEKEEGSLNLVYLSLIAEKKNLHLLLEAILENDLKISLDIYGPVKDQDYWDNCLQMIEGGKKRISYKGPIEPKYVQKCLEKYHSLVLPTKGENFGHALYESLSVGRPIITSYFTPWNDLKKASAGINVDISNSKDLCVAVKKFAFLRQDEYDLLCKGAHSLAKNYFNYTNSVAQYEKLFSF